MQDLDRDVALEREIPGAIHASKPAGADLLEQFVVVAERPAQPALESRFGHGRRGGGHLERPGVADEILEHFSRRVVALPGSRGESPHDHPFDGCRYRRAQLARWLDAPRIEIGRHAREGHVDIPARGVDAARWVPRFARSYLRRHERRYGI